jgi:hypothetical protein
MPGVIRPPRFRSIFNEQTLIPVSLVVVMLSAGMWISTLSSNADHNRQDTDKLAQHLSQDESVLREISDRLSRIEGKLDSLNEKSR